jgi:hypothetical protein
LDPPPLGTHKNSPEIQVRKNTFPLPQCTQVILSTDSEKYEKVKSHNQNNMTEEKDTAQWRTRFLQMRRNCREANKGAERNAKAVELATTRWVQERAKVGENAAKLHRLERENDAYREVLKQEMARNDRQQLKTERSHLRLQQLKTNR